MSKISDEIRKITERYRDWLIKPCKELNDLADRIDAEMIELPKSADGKIWTGREVCFWTNDTDEGYHQFDSLTCRNGVWFVEDIHNTTYTSESVFYERPDSWERIAAELEGLSVDSSDNYYVSTHCSKLANRIRKLAKEQGDE